MATRMTCETCGGELILAENKLQGQCRFCRNTYFFKEEKGEALVLALNRARGHRLACDFHEAIKEYSLVLEKFRDDAEAHFGMFLSTYGIEFVEDRRSGRFIPTCHRFVNREVLTNENYLAAMENAAPDQRASYKATAETVDRLQRGIKAKLDSEEPYDVFISFKANDENGIPTEDARIARNIYDALTKRGIRVFFSEVTLANRIGDEYEPIIYRALYSSRFFILVATREEYINSAWVKNEWTRFEDRIAEEALSGACAAVFRGISPYSLPRTFQNQGIDIEKHPYDYDILISDSVATKLGFDDKSKENDELQEKLREQEEKFSKQLADMAQNIAASRANGAAGAPTGGRNYSDVSALLKRAELFIADKDWESADAKCEAALDLDPENGTAYLYKMLIQLHVTSEDKLHLSTVPPATASAYKNAVRYLAKEKSEWLVACNKKIKDRLDAIETERLEKERTEQERKNREAALERERRAHLDKIRAEKQKLLTARNNTSSLIQSQINEKTQLEDTIKKNEFMIKNFKPYSRKLKTRVYGIYGTMALMVLGLILAMTPVGENFPVGPIFIMGGLIAMVVEGVLLAKFTRDTDLVLKGVFAYFSLGIYTVWYANQALKSCRLSVSDATNNQLRAQIAELDKKIDESRHSLKQINEKLEAYK